jgi:hypothetical protein
MPRDKLKRQITAEAARLVTRGQETNLARARLTAARNLARGWVRPADLPTDLDIREELQLQTRLTSAARPEADSREDARFDHYRGLLEPLAHVMQPRDRHPEGDALYHSLQVFVLVQDEAPWDEELLLAALLHDVGKGIDPLDHVAAGLEALAGWISERTEWLIANHLDAQRLHEGELGRRAMRRLRAHEDFDALLLLARCDRAGRRPGAHVPELEEALTAIQELARLCGDEDS